MNKKYIFLTLLLCFFNIQSISADCAEEIKKFKKIEDEYKVKYKAISESKDYLVTFYVPSPEEYNYVFTDEMDNYKYEGSKENSFTYSGVKPGEYNFKIIDQAMECKEPVKIITVKLPKFNKYAEDELCKGIEEFVLCSATYEKEIDYDTFVSRVETYKKTKAKKETEAEKNKEPEEKVNKLTPIISYIKNNLITIIVIVVFIVLSIITAIITAKSIRKSRRLE